MKSLDTLKLKSLSISWSDLSWSEGNFLVSLAALTVEIRSSTTLVFLSGELISYSATESWDISGVLVFAVSANWLLLRRARPPPTVATRASVRRTRAGRRPWEASADMRTHEQEEE